MADELQSEDNYAENGDWSKLTSLAVGKIYTFLCRHDQVNLSLVRPSWSADFDSASLWRTFKFALTEDMLNEDICTANIFAHKYGHLINRVNIEYELISKELSIKLWVEHFEKFLYILHEKSKLTAIKFRNFEYCFRKAGIDTGRKVFSMICGFLLSQRHLERLDFHQFSVNYTDGVTLLRIAIRNSRDCLRHLSLRDFVHKRVHHEWAYSYVWGSTREQIQPFIYCLPNLVNLEIDYSIVFEDDENTSDVLELLKNHQRRLNLKVWLFLELSVKDFKKLTLRDWRSLKEANPLLQVEIILFTFPTLKTKNEMFVVPNMPITHLDYKFQDPSCYKEVNAFMKHLLLCKTNHHLVHLSLKVARINTSVVPNFKPFLKACEKLKFLVLSITEVLLNLDIVLEFFLQNRPDSLQRFDLEVRKISIENVATMHKNSVVKYNNLFKSVNIDFRVKFQS